MRMQKTKPKSCLASTNPYLHRTIHSSRYQMCHTASHLCQTSILRKMESSSCCSKEVNVYKAIGPDLITNRILKDCCVELAPILTQIYKKSLRYGRLPQDWLSANVTAIFKKGARHEASNYRPVSLTSVTCKIFEHVLFSQIMRHYTRHMFINPLQQGFQKGLSCETQLATTVDQLQKRLDDKQQVDLIILDFQKAFNKVPHRNLLHKLHESGIHGQLHE